MGRGPKHDVHSSLEATGGQYHLALVQAAKPVIDSEDTRLLRAGFFDKGQAAYSRTG